MVLNSTTAHLLVLKMHAMIRVRNVAVRRMLAVTATVKDVVVLE